MSLIACRSFSFLNQYFVPFYFKDQLKKSKNDGIKKRSKFKLHLLICWEITVCGKYINIYIYIYGYKYVGNMRLLYVGHIRDAHAVQTLKVLIFSNVSHSCNLYKIHIQGSYWHWTSRIVKKWPFLKKKVTKKWLFKNFQVTKKWPIKSNLVIKMKKSNIINISYWSFNK